MPENNSLGRFIAGRRKAMSMTQDILAEKIGVSKSAVAKWETDGGLPDRDNLKRLADALKTSVDDLYRIIAVSKGKGSDYRVNITPDVIAALESYGYRILRPEDEHNDE